MRRLFNIYNTNDMTNNFKIIQNSREDIIGELDAIIQYENHLMETNDEKTKETIRDIIKEEKLHVGQLFGLLFSLDVESKEQFEKGYNEFQES